MRRVRYEHPRLSGALEYALTDWGAYRAAPVSGLGYNSIAPEAKIYLSPGRSTRPSDGPKFRFSSDTAREIEQITVQLRTEGLSAQLLALWCCWVQGMDVERATAVLGLSGADYNSRLKSIHERLAVMMGIACYHERRRAIRRNVKTA